MKNAVLKRSVFLYRKDFPELKQSRFEDPERFATRIKQLAPPCKFTTDNGTQKYCDDIMSTIFILGLEDSYTRERLYQIKPDNGKSTVRFKSLVDAASEIAVAKDNAAESMGSASMNQVRNQNPNVAIVTPIHTIPVDF